MLSRFVPIALLFAISPVDDKCPISGKPVSSDYWIVSEAKKIGFCCGNCLKSYIKDRDNRLSDAQKNERWKLLFNGADLQGFQKPTRDSKWEARDGVLTGGGGAGVLATEESYDSFILTADIRILDTGNRRGNSGIFIRSSGLTAQNGNWPDGLEIQADHGDEAYWTGSIWKVQTARKASTRDKEWFTLKIEAAGNRVRTWVNGELAAEYFQAGPVRKAPIALQSHHATSVSEFKNLKILPLRDA